MRLQDSHGSIFSSLQYSHSWFLSWNWLVSFHINSSTDIVPAAFLDIFWLNKLFSAWMAFHFSNNPNQCGCFMTWCSKKPKMAEETIKKLERTFDTWWIISLICEVLPQLVIRYSFIKIRTILVAKYQWNFLLFFFDLASFLWLSKENGTLLFSPIWIQGFWEMIFWFCPFPFLLWLCCMEVLEDARQSNIFYVKSEPSKGTKRMEKN